VVIIAPPEKTDGSVVLCGRSPSGYVTDTIRFTRRLKVNEVNDLIARLEQACDNWEAEYDYGVIPIAIVRGILGRHDEVSQLNKLYYGE